MADIIKERKAKKTFKTGEQIGLGGFLAITASMVLTVYEYPTFAMGGWSLILFLIVCGIFYFLPVAVAAAEMGTVDKWEKKGVYVWIRNTLGRRWGWFAIFSQWTGITIAFLAMMYFVIAGLGFAFGGTQGFDLLNEGTGGNILPGLQATSAYYAPGAFTAAAAPGMYTNASAYLGSGNNAGLAQTLTNANGTLDLTYSPYQYFGIKALEGKTWAEFSTYLANNWQVFHVSKGIADTVANAMWSSGVVGKGTFVGLDQAHVFNFNSAFNAAGVVASTSTPLGALIDLFNKGALIQGGGMNSASLVGLNRTSDYNAMFISGCIFGVAILFFILFTVISMLAGVKFVANFSKLGFWVGIAGTTAIIMIMGFIYVGQHHPVYQTGSGPGGSIFTRGAPAEAALLSFISIVVAFAGPEGSGNLANRLRNVEKNYPIAVLTLMFMSISFSIMGGTFIAVSTNGAINLTGGISVSLMKFFMAADPGMSVAMSETATRIIILIVCIGVISQIFSWIIGPSSGLQLAASEKLLPRVFSKVNKKNIASFNLMVQIGFVTLWEIIITLGIGGGSGVAGSFAAGLQASMIVYLLLYLLMFIGDTRLWIKAPNLPRAFSVKNKGFAITLNVVGFTMVSFAWCCMWINEVGPTAKDNAVWFGAICAIVGFLWLLAFITYEVMNRINENELCKKYGFNKYDYANNVRRLAQKLFMLKLVEEKVPEILQYFTDPELKPASEEEVREFKEQQEAAKKADKEARLSHVAA